MEIKRAWNVLVFPGGTENGLEIYRSLSNIKEVNLFSVSSRVKNHAEYVYENHYFISDIKDERLCLKELNDILQKCNIDYVFPANSLVIDFLVANRDKLVSPLLLQESSIVRKLRSKKETYNLFFGLIPIPKLFLSINEIDCYPIFIKPDSLYGSQGAEKIFSKEELVAKDIDFESYVVSEYLPGEEYTVECFSTKRKGILYSQARTRERIRMGTSMHSERASDEIQKIVSAYAETIFNKLYIDGLWFFQVKFDNENNLVLLEIETRVAGTMAYSRVHGVNLPLMYLYYLSGYSVDVFKSQYTVVLDRALENKYKTDISYNYVYVDLDDTIIIRDKLNVELIKFLYYCVNNNKKIILISKSKQEDKIRYLKRYRIENLFDEIIWLNEEDNKAEYIKHNESIFIDDSFSQRMNVQNKLGINTFDPTSIELLIK